MRSGRTLTRTMHIESQQHELMGIDLGEGIDRAAAGITIAAAVVWATLLWLLGVPWSQQTSLLWMGPPIALTVWGWTEGSNPRRRKMNEWILAARWIAVGHSPIIAGGRVSPDRSQAMTVTERIRYRSSGILPERFDPGKDAPMHAGRAIDMTQTVQLVGIDAMRDAVARTEKR